MVLLFVRNEPGDDTPDANGERRRAVSEALRRLAATAVSLDIDGRRCDVDGDRIRRGGRLAGRSARRRRRR